jgi:hypothetical protein
MKMDDEKIIPVILGKNEIHKSQFSDEFCSVVLPRARTEIVHFRLVFKINLPAKANEY